MATFNKVNDLSIDIMNRVHNFSTHTFKYGLSNTDPGSESSDPRATGNARMANVTEISYSNVSENREVSGITLAQVSDDATVDGDEEVLTASGGSVGPFQYVWLFNETAADNPIIGYWDYGDELTLNDGETFTITIPTVFLNVTQS